MYGGKKIDQHIGTHSCYLVTIKYIPSLRFFFNYEQYFSTNLTFVKLSISIKSTLY